MVQVTTRHKTDCRTCQTTTYGSRSRRWNPPLRAGNRVRPRRPGVLRPRRGVCPLHHREGRAAIRGLSRFPPRRGHNGSRHPRPRLAGPRRRRVRGFSRLRGYQIRARRDRDIPRPGGLGGAIHRSRVRHAPTSSRYTRAHRYHPRCCVRGSRRPPGRSGRRNRRGIVRYRGRGVDHRLGSGRFTAGSGGGPRGDDHRHGDGEQRRTVHQASLPPGGQWLSRRNGRRSPDGRSSRLPTAKLRPPGLHCGRGNPVVHARRTTTGSERNRDAERYGGARNRLRDVPGRADADRRRLRDWRAVTEP
ncbi:hypothetical protein HLASF_1058 [Halanaeroarchaeum sulfurireducens]|uniref:Uncharacterized protein n=1 Tax=Halanaeroarchaeum sulfurireducens TaxID=1604004 RepID=A0A0F7P9U0_9EURY|nr:hypothetical protein HLASF_1058 [Halanaeroarchaeum sulfurireducens]